MGDILAGITISDPILQNKVYVSWLYGKTLFEIVGAGWGVLATGYIGDNSNHTYNLAALQAYLQAYDNAWAAYKALGLSYSQMATLYLDTYFGIIPFPRIVYVGAVLNFRFRWTRHGRLC